MNDIPGKASSEGEESGRLRLLRWLVRTKATTGFRSPHFWIIAALFAAITYIYYAVLPGFYDVYLVIFFYPLVYTATVYRLRGVIIGGLVILAILLPSATVFSHDSYAMLRVALFVIFNFLICGLGGTLLNYLEQQLASYEEIMSLNRELNSYIERLESTQKQLIQAEKLNAIGQLAASVAHEINNPLAGVLVYTKLLLKKLTGDSLDKGEAVESLNKMETAVDHCSHIIRSLLDFSRQSAPAFGPANMDDIIKWVISLTSHQAQMTSVQVSVGDMSSLPVITADTRQLQQVFINLVVNAIQAMPGGGELNICGYVDNGWLKVSVKDTGSGIAPEDMDRIFIPFYTTKEKEKGTGLGLAVSYGIIERHNGRIEVESKPGEGSTFTVCLPR